MKFSCIALPDKTANVKIQSLMDQYSRESGSIKALAFPPHFSLWGDFEVDDENLPLLKEHLASIVPTALPLQITLRDYGFYPWRVVYLHIEKSEALQELHTLVMSRILRYRTPWAPQTLLDSDHFSGKQRQYIERFGYQFADEFYSPHFTLAGNDMSEDSFQTLAGKLKERKEHIDVKVSQIGLLERDSGHNAISWTSAA